METLDYNLEHWQDKKCPPINCKKDMCKCGLKKVFLPSVLGTDSTDSPIAPKNGDYCNAIVVYESNGHIYIYSKEGIPTLITSGGGGDYDEIIREIQEDLAETENNLAQEILDREGADNTLQEEIDAIKNSPDVVDIVPTYAALQAYDTSKLGDNDIIRVLQDEQHDGQSTYYRWNKQSSTWTYIGAVGDYYTKGQVDNLLDDKQDTLTAGANITIDANNEISATDTTYTAGANIQISAQNEISAADTTYTHFTGATASADGTQGLVPGPLAGDEDKFLKADGTWATAGGGGGGDTVYSTKTTSNQSDGGAVYIGPLNASQQELADPTTTDNNYRYFWAMPFDVSGQDNFGIPRSETINIGGKQISGDGNVTLGYRTSVTGDNNTIIGRQAQANGYASNVVIGHSATSAAGSAVVIGRQAETSLNGTVALGAYSQPTRIGEVNVGTSQSAYGYNSTKYRVIGGVHDGQTAHDAATVNQVNSLIDNLNSALNTNIPHIGA